MRPQTAWPASVIPFLALLVTSCSSAESIFDPPLAFTVDPAFGGKDQFQRAANEWNLFVIPSKRLSLDDKGAWHIVQGPTGNGYNGITRENDRTIIILPGFDAQGQYLIALHEFGHALGLHHTATGVMDPLHTGDTFSPEDLDECRRADACP